MKLSSPLMNALRLAALLAMLLKARRVSGTLPGSLNDQPPIAIQVSRPGFLRLSAVKRDRRVPALASIGVSWKVDGSKKANEKMTCVRADTSRSSGGTASHDFVVDQLA